MIKKRLNKEDILSEINSLPIEILDYLDQFTVIMGASLVLQGVKKDTDDIDVSVTSELFDLLILYGFKTSPTKSRYRKITKGYFAVYENWHVENKIKFSLFYVANFDSVIYDKLALGRDKDFIHCIEISSHLDELKTISNKQQYFPVYSYPNYLQGILSKGDKTPILILNGYFSSNKIGPHRLYYELSRELSNLDYPVLRIDLSGMGESDGDIKKVNFNRHVLDSSIILTKLLKISKSNKIHLIAHCSGCYLALKLHQLFPDMIDSITLVAPSLYKTNSLKKLLGEKEFAQLYKDGYTYRKGLFCDKTFIEAAKLMDNPNILESMSLKTTHLFIAGDDSISSPIDQEEWAKKNLFPYNIIKGADHNFLLYQHRNALFEHIKEIYRRYK